MQIASTPSIRLPAPLPGAADAAHHAPNAEGDGQPFVVSSHPAPTSAAHPAAAPEAATEEVSLSREAGKPGPAVDGTMVFAEIWKDGQKVAEVDGHGRVISHSGLVPPADGASTNGLLLASRRAARVAQAVGGEIRVAGQALDGETLVMRARLARAYGAAAG